MGKTIDIGGRIHNPEVGNIVTGANEILDDTKNKKQDVINSEVDATLEALDANKQDNLTFDQMPTESSTNPVTSGGVYAADLALQQAIEAILVLIPSAASVLNQLADKSFVNSSLATASATFRGTYNLVSDLHLSVTASHQDIATALASAVSTADNNDYCFVQIPTSDTSSDIRVTERYKFNGEVWMYEYDLNNSGFTAQQWEAINSTITLALVQKLGALPTAAELATLLLGKQNVLTFDNVPTSGSDNPVKSGGLYQLFTAIDAKFPSDASSSNKLVAENRLAAYVTAVIEALDASFDLTSADGHVTFKMTQTNGVIASVQILTSDIASASQVSTNMADIAALQAAYAGLTQSDIVIVNGALPSSGQQQNVIYRQPDPDHTPPQFYSDYMWNGTTWVLMATYNNAVDNEPTKNSNNLVKSGGVYQSFMDFLGETPETVEVTDNPVSSLIYIGYAWNTAEGRRVQNAPQTAALPEMTFIKIQSTKYRLYNYIFTQDIETGTKTYNQRLVPELDNLAKIDISNGFEYNSYGKFTHLTIVTPDDSAITDTPEQISKDIVVTLIGEGSEPTPVPEGVGETLISGFRKTANVSYYFIDYAWDTNLGEKVDISSELDAAAFDVSAFSCNKIIVQSSVYKLFNFYCTFDKDGNLSKRNLRIDPTKGNADVLDITNGVEIQGGERLCLTATTDGLTPLDENELKENIIVTKVLYSVEDRLSALENAGLLVTGPDGKKYQIYVADGDNGAELKIMEA